MTPILKVSVTGRSRQRGTQSALLPDGPTNLHTKLSYLTSPSTIHRMTSHSHESAVYTLDHTKVESSCRGSGVLAFLPKYVVRRVPPSGGAARHFQAIFEGDFFHSLSLFCRDVNE